MAQTSFRHEIAYIAARINIEVPNESPSTGTGFFYLASLNDEADNLITLLISNKHVFRNPKGKLIISLNRQKVDGTPEFGDIRTFDWTGFEGGYFPTRIRKLIWRALMFPVLPIQMLLFRS